MMPAMTSREQELLRNFLRCSAHYVEFGSGGSTVFAADLVTQSIISIDSNESWSRQVQETCAQKPRDAQLTLYHVDIGPVGDWGSPSDPATRDRWPDYHTKPWALSGMREADFYLIDGRFRVACAMQTLLRTPASALIAMHDFSVRPNYHKVLEFVREIACADTLSVFQRRPDCDMAAVSACLDEYRFVTS